MSKGLEALEVSKQLKDFVLEFIKNGLDRRFIHGSFDIIEKELKALEIIKNKKVCVVWLRNGLSAYNSTAALYKLPRLTEEEYDLLKEVLL